MRKLSSRCLFLLSAGTPDRSPVNSSPPIRRLERKPRGSNGPKLPANLSLALRAHSSIKRRAGNRGIFVLRVLVLGGRDDSLANGKFHQV